MTTSYIGSKTAAENGDEFTLSTGSSRAFFVFPSFGGGEHLLLQIKNSGGSSFSDVGILAENGQNTGVVTARGASDSIFRVVKSETSTAIQVFFD
tara:strand:+ start:1299 stop:1583 length:285 start_codon:yes stop_codon:yes gene_type:complete